MTNSRPITIYTATSRKSSVLQETPMSIQELFSRLSDSQTLPVTHTDYIKLPKAQQDELKDVGAYIAGTLHGGRRKAGSVITRCAAVIDADNLPPGGTEALVQAVAALDLCYCIHSTAKHSIASPRLRVLIPFASDIEADKYSPVIRRLCQIIQPEMSWFDPTTDEPGRIMYWATHCTDVSQAYHWSEGRGLLDAEALLQQILDWKDVSSWPLFPREQTPTKQAAKQEDPEGKTGVVGAFCRVYDIPTAMDKFLPGIYEPTTQADRFTFTGGSTAGGAVLYEHGKFLFSHHATDPCSGKLVNAFDVVRLHRFADLDDEAKEGTRGNRLPSYAAMVELARSDTAVSDELAMEAFVGAFKENPADEVAAMELGRYAGETLSLDVLRVALKAMGIQVKRNLITETAEIIGMPSQYSSENAINTLPVILMDKLRAVGVKGVSRTAVMDYLVGVIDENRYNPVLEMLGGTVWDGISRFPELLRILGVAEGKLVATLVRKWLIQCVAMANNTPERREAAEGVLTLQGGQGIGKTMFFRRLSVKGNWFAEGVTLDLKNKDDVMKAVGAWITELGELDSTLRRDQSSLKAFLTSPSDRIWAPYAREAATTPRRTSFCATVNPGAFLKDDTGDRRFWVIPVDSFALQTLIELSDTWFIQLWGEAVSWWKSNPQSFRLTPAERQELEQSNRRFREMVHGEEEIRQELNFDLPVDAWGLFTPKDLRERLFYNDRITVQQVGRSLSKLAKEDERITFTENSRSRIKTYLLPIKEICI